MKNNVLQNKFKIINEEIIHIIRVGVKFCILFCLIAIFILQIYCEKSGPDVFYIGISLLKSGMFFICMFIACGFVFDKIT